MSHFFIDRPISATVLSIVIVIVGGVSVLLLPIAQYPDVVPPTVQVSTNYPGANAQTVADTVATEIEKEVNGVENMIYMSSKCTNDGQMNLDVTFALGTDLDFAQVLVQNRVAIAEAKLPEEVKRNGVTTKKKSPNILLCVNLISDNDNYDTLYLSNYATLNIKDALARIKGVGDVVFLGPRDYSMRVWLDPNKLANLRITAAEVIKAIKEQNTQVAAGRLGQPPVPRGIAVPFQLPINAQQRFTAEEQFDSIIVKTGKDGEVVHLRDVVMETKRDAKGKVLEKGIELGAKNYEVNSYLDGKEAITIAIFQLPGSNALETARSVRETMERLKADFPQGVRYEIVYDTTIFVEESVNSVYHTLIEAIVLVFIVVLVFLQSWRSTVIPMIAVPVSLIGTFAIMALLGFSLNNLSLFGLVLAIGIVVDDAIVVVENVERRMAEGMNPRDATRATMDEVTGPIIATSLVMVAVFVPTAFLAGISGKFYQQFALTIAGAVLISSINSLTLSPAMCALILRRSENEEGEGEHSHQEALPRIAWVVIGGFLTRAFLGDLALRLAGMENASGGLFSAPGAIRAGVFAAGAVAGWFLSPVVNGILGVFFRGFNRVMGIATEGYGRTVGLFLRLSVILLIIYGGLIGLTVLGFRVVPTGFIPEQDKGYLVLNAQLPDGASLERADKVIRKLSDEIRKEPGVAHTIDVPGYSVLLSTNISNVGGMFVILDPFEERAGKPELSASAITARIRKKVQAFQEARVGIFGAPPVEGIGSTGGFKLQIQDRRGAGSRSLQEAVQNLALQGNSDPRLVGMFSSFSITQPQLQLKRDTEKAKALNVSLDDVNLTLQAYLGSYYVNDFTFQNRNWQVNVQAAPRFRQRVEDIGKLEVPNAEGDRVPLSTLITVEKTSGPAIVNHYNMYPSAEVNGSTAPGTSSAQATSIVDQLTSDYLPTSMGSEWTELTFQEILASQNLMSKIVFPLAVVLVFLVLAFQYESWSLPLAIILIVPMCLLSAIVGCWLTGLVNDIFVQIGLVVLVGLSAKNAILIVEFAKQQQDKGLGRFEATISASKLRLRPILMTSFAFILGVMPLVISVGAGSEMRVILGIAVLSGMLGVTIFGIFLTPVFYYVIRWFAERKPSPPTETAPPGLPRAQAETLPNENEPRTSPQQNPGEADESV